ncbi:MAG: S26 family signal peptidase [Pirellula sp.]|nr:S26 family signal peptidase [Pirellula sp.]
MNATAKTSGGASDGEKDPKHVAHHPQVVRETLESLAVAFILALMFKAFIAEAFVIPTGSMAPTLMGAHKDVVCEECGFQYQCGASSEFTDTGAKSGELIFGTICPLCRKPQILDLVNNPNHRTFTGDRILVSKLAYVFAKPERWQVFVFKHVEDARLNYIKRCLGRPNETIRIEHGDIYVSPLSPTEGRNLEANKRPSSGFEIARKPPHVIQAMLQPLSDTRYPAKSLIEAQVPDAWQPTNESNSDGWKIGFEGGQWTATVTGVPNGKLSMIRYRHRVLDPIQWESIATAKTLPKPIPPESYRLVTDFTAYNACLSFGGRISSVPPNYDRIAPMELKNALHAGFAARQYTRPMENDGLHWTGDLSGEFEVTTESNTDVLRLLLVEAGVEHRCDINLKDGTATATLVVHGQPVAAFEDGQGGWVDTIQAKTAIRSGAKHRLQLANVDDALTLWVDGSPVAWGNQGRYSMLAAIPDFVHAPQTEPSNPLDAAPVGIGVQGGGCSVTHARVARDIYYIAHSANDYLTDYNNVLGFLKESAVGDVRSRYVQNMHGISEREYSDASTSEALNRNGLVSDANAWRGSLVDTQRRRVTFELGDGAYFPLGDNSSASADARSWREHHVPERLLIGRAVLVFWPHYWNAPIPFLPNFQRMGLIR